MSDETVRSMSVTIHEPLEHPEAHSLAAYLEEAAVSFGGYSISIYLDRPDEEAADV